jgi:NADPH-dependent glutamate synthase beta subunit-like oxidoreductase
MRARRGRTSRAIWRRSRTGDWDGAYRINLRDNVFPGVLGRVCTRPCEDVCRHGEEGLGEPVAICASKRAAADFRKDSNRSCWSGWFPDSGKRVAVVGAGPAGLAVARELARWGTRWRFSRRTTGRAA